MIRDVCALRRGRGARDSTTADRASTAAARLTPAPKAVVLGPEKSPEPEGGTGGREFSPGFKVSEPYVYYTDPRHYDKGLNKFLRSTIGYSKYAIYQTEIRQLAQQLKKVVLSDNASGFVCTFDNGFESLLRSRYLILKYAQYMRTGEYQIDTDAKREIFVVNEMEQCEKPWPDDADGKGWLDYLLFFGENNLIAARRKFGEEVLASPEGSPEPEAAPGGRAPSVVLDADSRAVSMATPPPRDEDDKPSDEVMADPKDVEFEVDAGKETIAEMDEDGEDVPESPTSSKNRTGSTKAEKVEKPPKKASLGGTQSPNFKAKQRALQKEKRDELLERIKADKLIPKTGPQMARQASTEAATGETIDDKRKLLYENELMKSRWGGYSAQIATLAGHLRVLMKNEGNLFRPEGQGSVLEKVNANKLTGKLYAYLQDYSAKMTAEPHDYDQLVAKFKYTTLSDEYVILRAMDADCQEIENGGRFKEVCTGYEEWTAYLSKISPNVTDERLLSLMNLGSELHTFPADASLDLRQNLTRRLEALHDW
jgi:hypothetical protein